MLVSICIGQKGQKGKKGLSRCQISTSFCQQKVGGKSGTPGGHHPFLPTYPAVFAQIASHSPGTAYDLFAHLPFLPLYTNTLYCLFTGPFDVRFGSLFAGSGPIALSGQRCCPSASGARVGSPHESHRSFTMSITIHAGDCRTVLPSLPSGSVRCCVTSPPYLWLRDYGVDGQIGLEDSATLTSTEDPPHAT